MSEESVSAREKKWSDREYVMGQDSHVAERREVGEKLPSEVGAVDGIGMVQEVALDKSIGGEQGRDDEQLVDGAMICDGVIVEGSNTKVLVPNGHKQKVWLLIDIINSLQSPEEKLQVVLTC
ncbi:hypothetical protein V6N11_056003 [Hibiscus sabdariffa]|uniref:Uncharacterized protein n=2 Tax=Hibiscus sabdariffa TaxID=183260 RepID=A0ABR2T2I8_9ROSI